MSTPTVDPIIALAGSPNCGKTALFNALTGSRQKTANYPGVTVEKRTGSVRTPAGRKLRLLDLPGAYSLDAQTLDQIITRDVLLGKIEEAPEVLVAVADATSLERSLGLILELRKIGRPTVLALNMMDLAKNRGLSLDLMVLSQELGVPVIPTVAVKRSGISELLAKVDDLLTSPRSDVTSIRAWKSSSTEEIQERFHEVDRILRKATLESGRPALWTDRIDQVVLHPVWGTLILISLLVTMFQAVFNWCATPQDWIDAGVAWLGATLTEIIAEGPLQSLLVDGIVAGVGGVIIFLPQILMLFLFILLLEDSGYMARAAFLMDRMMGRVGLHGRAFIPMLSSYACAIPGIMATRTIENPRDRLATILISPLTTCAARLPVYTLLIAAFIPNQEVFGWFRLQGLVMFGLYAIGLVAALGVAFTLKRSVLAGPTPPLVLELPSYKLPNLRNIVMGLWDRARVFCKRAGTVILSLSVIVWFLASYPKAPQTLAPGESPIEYSYAGKIGKTIEPLFQPIGFDWRISTGLIPGFAAREVMVGALATVFAVEAEDEEAQFGALSEKVTTTWSLATALSLLVWYIFAPQCLSTLAVTRRETNSWKWPGFMFFYMMVLAYVGSLITYQVARWFV